MLSLRPAPPTPTGLAIFDFDHTLITTDSNFRFFQLLAGTPRLVAALLLATPALLTGRFTTTSAGTRKTMLKQRAIQTFLAGRTVAEVQPTVAQLQQQLVWHMPMVARLQAHAAAGHRVVVASGGLDVYLATLLAHLPVHDLICTQIGVADGRYTAELVGGNCVREVKAARLQNLLATTEPNLESWGYGNWPPDRQMLELLQHRVII